MQKLPSPRVTVIATSGAPVAVPLFFIDITFKIIIQYNFYSNIIYTLVDCWC